MTDSRFLHEAVNYSGILALEELSIAFQHIGDCWQEVALLFKESYSSINPEKTLKEISVKLLSIADMEKDAWERLYTIFQE